MSLKLSAPAAVVATVVNAEHPPGVVLRQILYTSETCGVMSSVAADHARSICEVLIGVAAGVPGVDGGVTSATVPVTKVELNSAAGNSPALELTVVSTRSACVVDAARAEGRIMVATVLSPFQVILRIPRQVAKLSALSCTESVQVPGPDCAVTVPVFMLRLKVTVMDVLVATFVAPEAGKTEVTANGPEFLAEGFWFFQKSP